MLDLLKSFFYDHPKKYRKEREFKRQIVGRILDLTYRKCPLKQEKHSISDPKLNAIASILGILKILSEAIVVSKCGPLVKTEKQAMP